MPDNFPGGLKFGKNLTGLNRRQGIVQILEVDRFGKEAYISVTHQEVGTARVSAHEAEGIITLQVFLHSNPGRRANLRIALIMVDGDITCTHCTVPACPQIELAELGDRFSENESVARSVPHVTV